jgi:hypothetical protein
MKVGAVLLQRISPFLAQSGHASRRQSMSAFEGKADTPAEASIRSLYCSRHSLTVSPQRRRSQYCMHRAIGRNRGMSAIGGNLEEVCPG